MSRSFAKVSLISQLATGKILDRVTNVGLRWSDCHAIGKHAITAKFYALAVDWLELAIEKLRMETTPMRTIVENDLESAILLVSSLKFHMSHTSDAPILYIGSK